MTLMKSGSSVMSFSWKESPWLLIAVVGPLLFVPTVRTLLHRWRLQRHLRQHPYALVVPKSKKGKQKRKERIAFLRDIPSFILSFIGSCFVGIFLLIVHVVSYMWTLGMNAFILLCNLLLRLRPMPKKKTKTSAKTDSGAPRSVLRQRQQQPPSARKTVAFSEHSNGTIKTTQYQYNPTTEPVHRVPAEPSQTPPKGSSPPPKPRGRIQRQQTPPAVKRRPRHIPQSSTPYTNTAATSVRVENKENDRRAEVAAVLV